MDTCCISRHPSDSTIPYMSKPISFALFIASKTTYSLDTGLPDTAGNGTARAHGNSPLPTFASPAGYLPYYAPAQQKFLPKHHIGASPPPPPKHYLLPSSFSFCAEDRPRRDAVHPQQRVRQRGLRASTLRDAEEEHRKLLTFDAPLGARGLAPAVAALPPAHVHPAGRAQRGEGPQGPPQPRPRSAAPGGRRGGRWAGRERAGRIQSAGASS